MDKRLFAIVTDSASDLPEEYYAEHDVECIRLGFQMNGVNYEGEDGKRIGAKEFYDILRSGAMPTTYQVTAEVAKPHFEKFLEQGRDVLVLAFSSGLSGTEGSYRVAARELKEKYPQREIVVVDSLCASLGQGLFVDYVVKKADSGAGLKETAEYAEGLKLNICHYFTVENLFHLKRGGRVSAATAVVGSLLNIKPVLHVDDEGHLVAVSKAMGRKKSVQALVKYMEELGGNRAGRPHFHQSRRLPGRRGISQGARRKEISGAYVCHQRNRARDRHPFGRGHAGAVFQGQAQVSGERKKMRNFPRAQKPIFAQGSLF